MKKNGKELNVDYIGGEPPLTLAEEQELNEYFKKKKSTEPKSTKTKTQKSNKKSKVGA
ncbi:MAG TPA: hypothetical protein VFG10_03895 [Saprospiraceae bacterium]|nr:hypothetical protein [Saprospiraceae bacterium]